MYLFLLSSIIFIRLFSFIYSDIDFHLILHSHMDPGWLSTYDQYYERKVRNIYNFILKYLLENPDRTFVYVEIINFKRWYTLDINDYQRQQVKDLVKSKRIEFVGGGLVMNDEATPYYQDIIDNIRLGNQFIFEEFNVRVKIGWYLDPFGHSAANAYIYNKLGYEYLFINRIDFQHLEQRIENGSLEFFWKPNKYTNDKVFTHIFPLHYGNGFYIRYFDNEDNMPNSANINNLTFKFIETINKTRNGFIHDQHILLLGDDFTFANNDNNVQKFFKIIEYFKDNLVDGEKWNFFFSTPSRYIKSIEKYFDKLKVEEDFDFFPYAEKKWCYWTGYFTSRPYLKGIIKKISNVYLIFSKLLTEYRFNYISDIDNLENLGYNLGLLQHHDAITGTAKRMVNSDYINHTKNNISESENIIMNNTNDIFQNQFKINKICYSNPIVDFGCENEFKINNTENNNEIIIGLYNPRIEGELLITIEFNESDNNNYYIKENENLLIKSDYMCIPKTNFRYEYNCILSFFYNFKKNTLFSSIILVKENNISKETIELETAFKENEEINIISNKYNIKSLSFNKNFTFLLQYYDDNKLNNLTMSISNGIFNGFIWNETRNDKEHVRNYESNADGAYIFTPLELYPIDVDIKLDSSYFFEGDISTSIILRNENTSFSIITFFIDKIFFKIDTILDKFNNEIRKNYLMLIKTNINNVETINSNFTTNYFYTDSNGLYMIKRYKNYSTKFEYTHNETVSNNFYPVTSYMSIKDDDMKLNLFNDRPQSIGCLRTGEIIVILNRQSTVDDWKGLSENLYENESLSNFFKITHILTFGIDSENTISKNFAYNYFHNTPFLFKTEKKFDNVNSVLDNVIISSKNIREKYQIINKDLIIVQFYVDYDEFFERDKNLKNGIVSIRTENLRNLKIKIKIDFNGVEYMDISSINEQKKFLFDNNINTNIKISNNDLVFVHFYLENY